MRIVILNSRRRYILIAVLLSVFSVSTYLFVQKELGLGDEYQYISGRADDFHIRKDDKIVINSTIVDFDIASNYIVGLRMPVQRLECDGGDGYKIKLTNKREYFILSADTGNVLNFISKEEFEGRLKDLSVLGDVSLDYSKFESMWERYSKYYENIDYSTCVPMNH